MLSKNGLISFVTKLSFQETQVAVYQLPGQPWHHMGLHAANEGDLTTHTISSLFGSVGKIFNPMFEKIILKCVNPEVESRGH